MPFLLAEILNFQCVLHLKGVGSLNYIIDINDDSYIVMDKKYIYKKFNNRNIKRKLQDSIYV